MWHMRAIELDDRLKRLVGEDDTDKCWALDHVFGLVSIGRCPQRRDCLVATRACVNMMRVTRTFPLANLSPPRATDEEKNLHPAPVGGPSSPTPQLRNCIRQS
jgi:hypothetical protein